MRFVTMSLVSYAGAAIVMFQAVDRLIGADRYSCMCLENLSGGLGSEFDAFEGVHIIPRCDHLSGPPRYTLADPWCERNTKRCSKCERASALRYAAVMATFSFFDFWARG